MEDHQSATINLTSMLDRKFVIDAQFVGVESHKQDLICNLQFN